MIARTTNDYERMAQAGVRMIVEPAFWIGEPRKSAGTMFDYYDHMLTYETKRAAQYGIDHYVAISINPREANNRALSEAVFKELPRFLEHPRCVAIGEIGFDAITADEEDFLVRQIELAKKLKLPLLVHSPHIDKKKGIEKILELIGSLGFPYEDSLIDHSVEETTALVLEKGAWCGHTIYPMTKLSPERAISIILKHGTKKMMINSSADWGPSDPMMVAITAKRMMESGFYESDVDTLCWQNPFNFFTKSGKIK